MATILSSAFICNNEGKVYFKFIRNRPLEGCGSSVMKPICVKEGPISLEYRKLGDSVLKISEITMRAICCIIILKDLNLNMVISHSYSSVDPSPKFSF
ncbi:hypothetical protein AMTRI_Chr08g206800 [Amborella trichopoda]